MHKDPPPTLFDRRRPLSHVISHGMIAGFALSLVVHFGWTLWRQNTGAAPRPGAGSDALVSGITSKTTPNASPAATADVRYR